MIFFFLYGVLHGATATTTSRTVGLRRLSTSCGGLNAKLQGATVPPARWRTLATILRLETSGTSDDCKLGLRSLFGLSCIAVYATTIQRETTVNFRREMWASRPMTAPKWSSKYARQKQHPVSNIVVISNRKQPSPS